MARKQTCNINHVANKINYEIATRKLFITQTDNPKNIPPDLTNNSIVNKRAKENSDNVSFMPSRPYITFQSNLYNKVATTKTPNQASVSLKRRGGTFGELFGDPISIHKSLNGVTVDGVDKNEVTWYT